MHLTLRQANAPLQLLEDHKYYLLCAANTKGERKDDYPPFAKKQLLVKTNRTRFIIILSPFAETSGLIQVGDTSRILNRTNNSIIQDTSISQNGKGPSQEPSMTTSSGSGFSCCKKKQESDKPPKAGSSNIKEPLLNGTKGQP